jgi:hypothetical protein
MGAIPNSIGQSDAMTSLEAASDQSPAALARLARTGDIENFRSYLLSDAFLAAFNREQHSQEAATAPGAATRAAPWARCAPRTSSSSCFPDFVCRAWPKMTLTISCELKG